MFTKTTIAEIDISALRRNFTRLKKLAPNSKILSVLKANAYGHGLVRIAKALTETDAFGVARIDEALSLRAGGITKPIVLLEGFFHQDDLPVMAINGLTAVIHNEQQLAALEQSSIKGQLAVWLKIDTGMHRLGIEPELTDVFYQRLRPLTDPNQPLVLMSHLACADEVDNRHTRAQIALFDQLTAHYQQPRSLANSAGALAWPTTHFDWIRPGVLLYGVSPMQTGHAIDIGFEPVMTLKSRLISIRQVKAGESIGYGAAYQCQQDSVIGVVAIGYGDGYPRHAKCGTPVLINGREVPLVGRVSMDMITVDLGPQSVDKIGDDVILWGKGLAAEKVAQCADTIPYELLCNVTRRVQIATLDH